jgi:hypothetical protein
MSLNKIEQELWVSGLCQGRVMELRSMGASMLPALRSGDRVKIAPHQDCRLGDIILFRRGEALLLHRVVAKAQGVVITKGDAASRPDQAVPYPDILGRAIFRERQGKISSLDTFWSRSTGMAFSLMLFLVAGLRFFFTRVRRLGREQLGIGLP